MKNKLKITLSSLLLVLLTAIFFLISPKDDKLHVYFCNVGQGDASYLRFPDGSDLLIDGGPNEKVLECLSKAMPFYDREITAVILTHPQADHLSGLIPVLKRYKVDYFISSPVGNNTKGYQEIEQIIREKKILVKNLYSGAKIEFGAVKFVSLWPEKEWTMAHLASANGSVLGVQSTDPNLNDFTVEGIITYNDLDILFTGDADIRIQDDILRQRLDIVPPGSLEIMKVPHHGAKTSLSEKFLDRFTPELAIISVGKNSYGHPSEEILGRLGEKEIKILRTDQEGTIEIISDGKSWEIK